MRDHLHMILHDALPEDMRIPRALPGVQPVPSSWLHVDEAYSGQMARREELLVQHRADVLWHAPHALEAACELLDQVCTKLPRFGFKLDRDTATCPDGRSVPLNRADPLATLGRLVQCDFCLLEKVGDEHILQGAVLCFPASWTLSEKAGRPLTAIHDPVPEYDHSLAKRVQRLFDGVQVGRPLWRSNYLHYLDAELHQPRLVSDPRPHTGPDGPYIRAERQTILRLPVSGWVVFAIHTYVTSRGAHERAR